MVETALREARAALQRGDTTAAEASCRRVLASDPANATAWVLLGSALRHRDAPAAEQALRRALQLEPDNADARFHLGNVLRAFGRHGAAISEYRAILGRAPAHPSVLNNLGLSLLASGDADGAERAFREVLVENPDHRQALGNLVHVLCRRRRHAEALEHGARYLARSREAPAEFWVDMGIAHHALLDYDAAVACFERALAREPADTVALANLAQVLIDAGRFADAATALRRAHDVAPQDVQITALLAYAQQHVADWSGLGALHAELAQRTGDDAGGRVSPFVALSMPLSAAQQQGIARQWAALIEAPPCHAPAIVHERGTRLRIGYVSSDFRVHALAFLATEVWERHDRSRVATFAYALAPRDDSPMRRRIRQAFETFRDLGDAPAAAAAQTIADDDLDVLIDLNGYTTHARSEILAAHPARVQAQWLGYLGTMGASWMDHVITDAYVSPPSAQQHFDERFLYLPECYCPSDTQRVVGVAADRVACGLPQRAIVLCCFNALYKLLPAVFDVWLRVLKAVPDSVLWLAHSGALAADNLRRVAAAQGVDPSRLVFAPRAPIEQHLARHRHADLYLDTTPYNAGTAANDALFMGIPVLTCSGSTMASRVAGSQVHAIGLPTLVTTSLDAYEARALELAGDRPALRALQEALASNRVRSSLFDMARFTHDLEIILARAAG